MNQHEPVVSGRHASVLEARRLCKIASSPHAYVRGTTERFYDLIGRMPPNRIPEGPPVWICGDCHLGNLGAVANEDGRIDIQIRDLDQTVIANPASTWSGLRSPSSLRLRAQRCLGSLSRA